jgi:hypothetical protein
MTKDPFDPLPEPPAFEGHHLDFAWKTHEYLHNYVRFADTKAALVIAWCSTVLGALYAAGLHSAVAPSRFTVTDWSGAATAAATAVWLLAPSLLLAAWAIAPRLNTKQRGGLVFWDSIRVNADEEIFARALAHRDPRHLTHHLCIQIYTVAGIAKRKYWCVLVSVYLSLAGSILAGLAFLLKHCS